MPSKPGGLGSLSGGHVFRVATEANVTKCPPYRKQEVKRDSPAAPRPPLLIAFLGRSFVTQASFGRLCYDRRMAAELERLFEQGALVRPSDRQPNLVHLIRAIAATCAVEGAVS
jgi:hypothetical protein